MTITEDFIDLVFKADEAKRLFFDESPLLNAVGDLKGNFIAVNKAWTKKLGFTKEELLKTPFMELIHPDDIEKSERAYLENQKLDPGEKIPPIENRYRKKGGGYVLLKWNQLVFRRGEYWFASAEPIELKNDGR